MDESHTALNYISAPAFGQSDGNYSVASWFNDYRKERKRESLFEDSLNQSRSKRIRADVSNSSRNEAYFDKNKNSMMSPTKQNILLSPINCKGAIATPMMTNTTKATGWMDWDSVINTNCPDKKFFVNFNASVKKDLNCRLKEISMDTPEFHEKGDKTEQINPNVNMRLYNPIISEDTVARIRPSQLGRHPLNSLRLKGKISPEEEAELWEYFNNGQGIDLYEQEIKFLEANGKDGNIEQYSDQSTNCPKSEHAWGWVNTPKKHKTTEVLKAQQKPVNFVKYLSHHRDQEFEESLNPESEFNDQDENYEYGQINFDSDEDISDEKRVSRFDPNTYNTPSQKTCRQVRYSVRFGDLLEPEAQNYKESTSRMSINSSSNKSNAQGNFFESLLKAPKKDKPGLLESNFGTPAKSFNEYSQDRLRLRSNMKEVDIDNLEVSQIRNESESSLSRFNDQSWSRPAKFRNDFKTPFTHNKSEGRKLNEQCCGVEEKLRKLRF